MCSGTQAQCPQMLLTPKANKDSIHVLALLDCWNAVRFALPNVSAYMYILHIHVHIRIYIYIYICSTYMYIYVYNTYAVHIK